MKIPLPPLPEQKAIASILSSCDETITGTQKLIEKLELRHKTLCQQLLTGKKRVEGFDGKWKEEKIEKYITYTPREIVKPKEDYLAL
jgi:type I restriction enzyme S subunit